MLRCDVQSPTGSVDRVERAETLENERGLADVCLAAAPALDQAHEQGIALTEHTQTFLLLPKQWLHQEKKKKT